MVLASIHIFVDFDVLRFPDKSYVPERGYSALSVVRDEKQGPVENKIPDIE